MKFKQLALLTLISMSHASLAQENARLAELLQTIDTSTCGHLAVAWMEGGQSGSIILSKDNGVTVSSLYEIGSITKGLTGIALARAVLNDQVSLSDDVYSLLPFKDKKLEYLRGVTLEDLATHTSGLPRIPSMGVLYALRHRNNPYAPIDEAVLKTALTKTKLWNQGEANYSNLGFGLLGYLVAKASRQTYADMLEQAVLEPLGMNASKVHYASVEGTDLAPAFTATCKAGYRWTFQEPTAAAGAVKSNLHDMRLLLAALLEPEQTTLADAIALATEPRRPFDDATHTGFGWLTQTVRGETVLWHNGGTGSFASFIGVNKARGWGVVVLFNKPMHDAVTQAGLSYLTNASE